MVLVSEAVPLRLRPYQVQAAKWLSETGRRYLASDRGTGKTAIAIAAIRQCAPQRTLVLCPKVALGVWQNELQLWSPDYYADTFLFQGKKFEDAPVVLCPYSRAVQLLSIKSKWDLIVLDESHYLRNRKTQIFNTVRQFRSDCLFALSGSPIVNTAADLWSVLHLINPREFSSYWSFIDRYFFTERNSWGGVDVIAIKSPEKFREVIAPYILRLDRKEVLPDMPPKIRQKIPVVMEPEQKRLYLQVANELIAELDNKLLLVPNTLAKFTRLRQILVTPALIEGRHSSAAFDALEENLQIQFQAKQPAIVFTSFTAAIPYLVDLAKRIRAEFYVVRGGMSPKSLAVTIQAFQHSLNPRRVLFCSLFSGSSFTATKAKQAHFLGCSWTAADMWQAEDRIHRIGQDEPVVVNYYMYRGTIDDHVWSIVSHKANLAALLKSKSLREILLPTGTDEL